MVTPAKAFAAAGTNRQERERYARKACLSGQVADGVSVLADLYLDTRDPTYLFNQGRCFQQNRQFEDAIGRFEEYLRAAETSPKAISEKDKADAQKQIVACKALLAENLGKAPGPADPGLSAPAAGQPPPPSTTPTPPAAVAQSVAAPIVADTALPVSPPASPGSGLRVAGIVLAATGVAAGVTGLVFNLKANRLSRDMEDKVAGYNPDSVSQRRNYQTLAWVGYGVGAASVVTGVVLYIVGARQPDTGSSLALSPAVSPDQAGFLLTGVF